jgi:hypothetical protein
MRQIVYKSVYGSAICLRGIPSGNFVIEFPEDRADREISRDDIPDLIKDLQDIYDAGNADERKSK